jgi:hypothetical protein
MFENKDSSPEASERIYNTDDDDNIHLVRFDNISGSPSFILSFFSCYYIASSHHNHFIPKWTVEKKNEYVRYSLYSNTQRRILLLWPLIVLLRLGLRAKERKKKNADEHQFRCHDFFIMYIYFSMLAFLRISINDAWRQPVELRDWAHMDKVCLPLSLYVSHNQVELSLMSFWLI